MRKEKFLEKVLTARVYDVARETPLDFMPRMSRRLDNQTYIKREDLQPVFSFKCRGAFNKIFQELQDNPEPRPGCGAGGEEAAFEGHDRDADHDS